MNEAAADPQAIHRLAKLVLDRGDVASVEEAENRLRSLSVQFHIDAEQAHAYHQQATLLTAVACARRVFLGGVFVSGALDAPLVVPMSDAATLGEAVHELGGAIEVGGEAVPLVYIGGPARRRAPRFAVRTVGIGWRGGILPAYSTVVEQVRPAMPLAAAIAGAFAVNEAFLAVNGRAPFAGKRSVGLSLWSPAPARWLDDDGAPELAYLPSKLWLIGLGHLGQAYLWNLGLLPYSDPAQVELLLQDDDRASASTWSTSILTAPPDKKKPSIVGVRKTRLMAAWAERRGFRSTICERRFNARVHREDYEPAVALCGVDNPAARRALDKVGFEFVVSAGLGNGYRDFQTLRIHTLPAERDAEKIWPDVISAPRPEGASAYQPMIEAGTIDSCGATLLAGVAVGSPFVGLVAGALAIAEVLRLLHGGVLNSVVDLDLVDLDQKSVVSQALDLTHLNPGFVTCAWPSFG